jgi:hypothetical protein
MITELTIIGIVIAAIGIVVFATGIYVYSVQSSNIEQCQSITEELGQFLDPEVSEVCRTAASSITLSLIAIIAGIVMIVIGGVLSGVGALRKSPSRIATTTTQSGQVKSSPTNTVEQEEEHGVTDEKEYHSLSTKSDIPLVADELSKLLALKEKGVLTEEEFARLKKNLLDGKKSNA